MFGVNASDKGYTLVVGIPDASWEYCKDGKTLTIDLSSVGVPMRFLLFGCRNQQEAKDTIMAHNKKHEDKPSLDMTEGPDFAIKEGGQTMASLKNKVY